MRNLNRVTETKSRYAVIVAISFAWSGAAFADLMLAINPVFTKVGGRWTSTQIEIPGCDTEVRHLRAPGKPPNETSRRWQGFLDGLVKQTRELSRLPSDCKRIHISGDGAGIALWKSEIRRHKRVLFKGVGFEIFDPGASQALGAIDVGGFQTVRELNTKRIWRRRSKAVADWRFRSVPWRSNSLTYGSLCTQRHNPSAYVKYARKHGENLVVFWAIEGWSQRPGDALYPWQESDEGRWDLLTLSKEYFERLWEATRLAESYRMTVMIYITDHHGMNNQPKRGRWGGHPLNGANADRGIVEDVPIGGYPRGVWATSGPFWEEVLAPMYRKFGSLAAEFPKTVVLVLLNEARADILPRSIPVGPVLGDGSIPVDIIAWHNDLAAFLRSGRNNV